MGDREFTSASFYEYLRERRLMAARCKSCGRLHLPPRSLCPHCQSTDMEWVQVKERGKLAAFTAIAVAPSFMVEEGYGRTNPYCTGIVELEEGPRITALILGADARVPEKIQIGAPASVEFPQEVEEGATPILAFRV